MNSRKNSRNQLSPVEKTRMILLEKIIRPAMLTLGVALALSAVPPLSADTVYAAASSIGLGGSIQIVDTATNTVSNLFTDPSRAPQGLIFNGPNDILYTTGFTSAGLGTVSDYNLVTHSSSVLTTLATGLSGGYLALDPGGATVLFDTSGSGIKRLNLSTDAVTNVSSYQYPMGLAYDAAGHLFALLGSTGLAQIDPVSGAVIKSITFPSTGSARSAGGVGLTFDPVSGHLFVAYLENGPSRGIFEIPTDLSSATLVVPGLVAAGLVADGSGHLFIAGGASGVDNVDEYTIATHTLTTGPIVGGITDVAVAPTTTLAPPPPPPSAVPEPASLLLLGIGLGAMGILQRRFNKA